jgi:uncharacterized membrane protein required for colicin V production
MMDSPFTVVITYEQLMLLIMGLFMVVGAMRGFYREVITTAGLVALLAILLQPALAAPIINYAAKFLRLVLAFIASRGSVDLPTLMSYYEKITVPFDGSNPYAFLIVALVGFVLLSYGTRNGKDVTALSRILGGVLGLLNGYLVIFLFKEYIVKYIRQKYIQQGALAMAQATPGQVSVALKDLPTGGLLEANRWQIVIILLGVIATLLFVSTTTGMSLKKKKDKGG